VKILAELGVVAFASVFGVVMRAMWRRATGAGRYKIVPRHAGGDMQAVYLERGDERIQVGAKFDKADEMALDEHMLDAERLRKRMERT
jgi:hypothetical protein